ncbi:MAG: hypothetical protein P1V36_06410 [Planctomycetota bacterium]|nr:hypothetical protein [Planctomycetota bacterium]
MDDLPPADASAPESHAAEAALPNAPERVMPISGLAISALVLSFVCGFVSLVGPWKATLIPIGLAALALALISKTGKRGRIPAIFAILISLAFGSCSYMLHTQGREAFAAVPRGMLQTLSDEKLDAAATDEAMLAWAWPAALEADPGLVPSWREAFDALVAELGPWGGTVESGDHVPGFTALVVPPTHGDEIRPRNDDAPPAPGGGIWVKVPFEKGTVWMCTLLGTGREDDRKAVAQFKENAPSPVVGGVRYFRLE